MGRRPWGRAAVVFASICGALIFASCNGGTDDTGSPAPSTPTPAATSTPTTTGDGTDVSAEARAIIVDLGGRDGPNGVIIDISADLLFDSGSSTLKPDADTTIEKVARLTRLIRRDRILIVGHTDDVGSGRSNQQLSVDRAMAVADALRGENAAVSGRIVVRGAGERRPVADNSTEEGRAKNRRVEIEFQGVRLRR